MILMAHPKHGRHYAAPHDVPTMRAQGWMPEFAPATATEPVVSSLSTPTPTAGAPIPEQRVKRAYTRRNK
jgi:hypothetical protein